jgi:hypothetical protein
MNIVSVQYLFYGNECHARRVARKKDYFGCASHPDRHSQIRNISDAAGIFFQSAATSDPPTL